MLRILALLLALAPLEASAQQLLSGHSLGNPPSNSSGLEGQWYLDLDTGGTWFKTSGAWTAPAPTLRLGNIASPISTIWYNATAPLATGVGSTQSAGLIECLPIWLPVAQHWDRLANWINTVGSTNLQYAIYVGGLDATTGRIQPQGAALATSSNIADTGTGATPWTISPSQAVGPGFVFTCTAYGDATVKLLTTTSTTAAALIGTLTAGNSFSLRGLSYAGSFGTWPNFTGVTMTDAITGTEVPYVTYRVSSVP